MAADYWQEFYKGITPRAPAAGPYYEPGYTLPQIYGGILPRQGSPGGIMGSPVPGTPSGIPVGTQVDPSAPIGAGNAGQPSGFGVGRPPKVSGLPSDAPRQSWQDRAWESGPGMAPHMAQVQQIGGMWPRTNSGVNQRIGEALVADNGGGNIFDTIGNAFGNVVSGAGDLLNQAGSGVNTAVDAVGNVAQQGTHAVADAVNSPVGQLLRLFQRPTPEHLADPRWFGNQSFSTLSGDAGTPQDPSMVEAEAARVAEQMRRKQGMVG